MPWDQTELFAGILAEFAGAQSAHTLKHAREAEWASVMRAADVKRSAEWRRKNRAIAKAYGEKYRAENRERERERVRRWKLKRNGKRCARCKEVQSRTGFHVVRKNGRRTRMAYCIPCQRTVSRERMRRIRAEARAA